MSCVIFSAYYFSLQCVLFALIFYFCTLQSLIRLPKSFYDVYGHTLPSNLSIESIGGTSHPAVIVFDKNNAPYLDTNTRAFMELFGVDGFFGMPIRREVVLSYKSSRGLFEMHVFMTRDRFRPRLMRRQPPALQVEMPRSDFDGPSGLLEDAPIVID